MDEVHWEDDGVAYSAKQDKRLRLQFRFWLNAYDEKDRDLIAYIKANQKARTFQKMLRNAIGLYWTLQQGRVDWLVTMFPGIKDRIDDYYRSRGGQGR